MFPSLAMHKVRDRFRSKAVFSAQFGEANPASGMARSDSNNLRVSQLGLMTCHAATESLRMLARWVFVTTRTLTSTLASHILHVLLMRTQKQVRRVAAWGVVASVTDLKPLCNRAIGKFVGYAMRTLKALAVLHAPIPALSPITRPEPTLIGSTYNNVLPEAVFDGDGLVGTPSMPRDEAHGLAFHLAARWSSLSSKAGGLPTPTFTKLGRNAYTFHVSDLLGLLAKPRPVLAGAGVLRVFQPLYQITIGGTRLWPRF